MKLILRNLMMYERLYKTLSIRLHEIGTQAPLPLSVTLSNYAAQQTASMKRSNNAQGIFIMSVSWWDMDKWRCSHHRWRTKASASEKVGRVLRYHTTAQRAMWSMASAYLPAPPPASVDASLEAGDGP